ncbi:MAG TPA: SpoIID/LytB domain-containing protein [Gaiellaceae bacterium]|nr:SpoIID/LytB domain-containing protein [Gaiellaceae bacterium]
MVIFRRAIVLVLLLSALLVGRASAGFTPPALKGTPQFVISGHGWGHAVGMGQWGAYGYAQHGFTYDKILAHYYPGTVLSTTTVKSIRVLLANTPSVTISSTGPWKLKAGSAATTTMPAGKVTLNPQLKFKLPDGTEPETFTGPLTFTAATPLVFKKPYRGAFTVTSDGKKITLVNTVPLEQYLYAVVPSEMPKTWLPEALKTQAVAARSYALAVRKTSGPFDVYDDTRSQVYGGVNAESPTTTAAVDATVGGVLTYGGKIAITYFFSTSGGRTAAINDVWKSAPVPYLVSVVDPYDSLSPYHDWGPLAFTPAKLKKVLKVPGRLLDVQTMVNGSQRVDSVRAIGEKGEHVLTGAEVRTALGLRSTWFSVGVLALDPLPATTLQYGTSFRLTGLGRALPDLRLEQRAPGTAEWVVSRDVDIDDDGSFSVAVKAATPEEFRVTSGTIATPSTRLVVAPRVAVKVSADLTTLKGSVRPALPGTPVQIQHQNATTGRWGTVSKVDATRTGRFAWTPRLLDGTYRARVIASGGWAVGLSKKVSVG